MRRLVLVLILAVAPFVLGACATHGPGEATAQCLSECTPRIGVMAAFGQEADVLIGQMQDMSERRINGNRFVLGRLQGLPVVLVLSGVSLPNSVMVSQLMLDHFQVTQLLFTGIAGGLDPTHAVGDIVIPQAWALQQETYYAASTALPKPCGATAGDLSCLGLALDDMRMPYGDGQFLRQTNVLNSANWQQVALRDSLGGAPVAHGEMRSRYPVDAAMLATLRAALPAINGALEPLCVPGQACSTPHASVSALGVSGSSFVAHPGYREYLHRQLGAGSVDMETAGVAHVAYANRVPFLAFRSLSDLAGSDEHPEAVGQFFSSGIAQRNAARVTLGFLKAWAGRP